MILDCPHCGTKSVQAAHIWNASEGGQDPAKVEHWQVVQCQNGKCSRFIMRRQLANGGKLLGFYPPGTEQLSAAAPAEIREDYEEAARCLHAGCFKASMVMSRRALQRTLKAQGCTQHKLVDAIKHAVESNILRKAFHPLAEEIREFGNLGAHPDDDQLSNANQSNAEEILAFINLIVEEFYDLPARALSLKEKRTANA